MIKKFFNWIDEKTNKLSINSFLLSYEENINFSDKSLPQSLIYSEVMRVGNDKRLLNKWDFEMKKERGNSEENDKIVLLKDIKNKEYYLYPEEFEAIKKGMNNVNEKHDFFISCLYLPNEVSSKKIKVLSFRIYIQFLDYQPSKNKY